MSVAQRLMGRSAVPMFLMFIVSMLLVWPVRAAAYQPGASPDRAVQERVGGGEANLVLPDLSQVDFWGIDGRTLLMSGLVVCALGLLFGLMTFTQLRNLPVHSSMREISELIYETCKTYLITQGKFILILEVFIGVIIVFYFGVLEHYPP